MMLLIAPFPSVWHVTVDNWPHESYWAVLLQIALLAAALWLAFETRKLRRADEVRSKQNEEQLAFLGRQARLAMMPTLVVGPLTYEGYRNVLGEWYPGQQNADERSKWANKAIEGNQPAVLIASIWNPSDRTAFDLTAVYCDSSRHYMIASDGAEFLLDEKRPFM